MRELGFPDQAAAKFLEDAVNGGDTLQLTPDDLLGDMGLSKLQVTNASVPMHGFNHMRHALARFPCAHNRVHLCQLCSSSCGLCQVLWVGEGVDVKLPRQTALTARLPPASKTSSTVQTTALHQTC